MKQLIYKGLFTYEKLNENRNNNNNIINLYNNLS